MDFNFSGILHNHVKSDVILYDQENQVKFSDKLRFIYLEMPKFDKTLEELETNYDKWLYILKNISKMEEIPPKLQQVLFEKVFDIAKVSNYNPKERQAYEESLKYYRDYYNTIATAKNDGREEGVEAGRKEALLETAKKMKNQGFETIVISEMTGLSDSEINSL